MASIEDFVSRFHNLDGITLGEKQKSFRRLLNENALLLEDVNMIDSIIKKITPKTHLEELLKLQILLHCQRMVELKEIFTSGNEILICKIIKHDWFIKKLCLDMDEQELVNKLLPCLSYSIRMKVLKKISLCLNNDDKVYIIFKAVKERYSLQVAMPLVLGCSVSHIELILKNHPVKFTRGQFKHFMKKAPKLLPLYIEEHVKHFNEKWFMNDNSLLRYIALIDYDVYSLLKKEYKLEVSYGKRQSRKLFENEKEEILDNLDYYNEHLSGSIFVRKLGRYGAFKKYLCEAFVRKLEDFSYNFSKVSNLLQYYPQKKQFQLLEECFEEVYKVPLVDCPNKITTQILDMIPDLNKREKIVEKKIQIGCSDIVDLAVYLPTSKSIPIIKKEMDLSANDIRRRRRLIKALVTTCKMHSDTDTLKQVIKYMSARHRNDVDVLDTFFPSLIGNFDLHKLTKELWDSLIELINIYKLKDGDMSRVRSILLMYLEFLYNSGEPITDSLLEYMKNDTSLICKIWSHKSTNYKFIQDLVPLGLDCLSKICNDELIHYHRSSLLVEVLKWNKNHQDYQIMIENRQEVYESLKKELENVNFHHDLKLLICRKVRDDKIMEITDLLWNKHLSDLHIILYFLKWYPSFSEDHMKPLIEALPHFQAYQVDKVFQWIKKYDHLKLPENVQKCCRHILDEKIEDNAHLVKYLARLMNPDDYIHFVEKYKPKKLSVDLINEEDKEIYKLQGQIVEGFGYVFSSVALTCVINYCGEDFLKYALAPLYKCFYRLPEDKLDPFFDKLVKKSVSVRKHGVFLAAQISDQEKIKNMLKSVLAVEKNLSLQKRLVLTTLNLFKQNASNEFWELFKYGLTLIAENDKDTFDTLVYVNYIPIDYQLKYYEEIWNLTANPKLLESNRQYFRNQLISQMKSHVKDLPAAFCITVIETLFFKFHDGLTYNSYALNDFISEFLLHHKDPSRFDRIYQKIADAKTSSLNASELKSQTFREFVYYVDKIHDFWKSKGYSKDWNQDLLKEFVKKLSDLYPGVEFFREYLNLLLMINLIDLNEININECVVKVSEFWHSMVDKYGPYVIEFLESTPMEYLDNTFLESNTVKLDFIREYLEISKSELDYIIAFKLCPSLYRDAKDIVEKFKACDSSYVQIQLRCQHMFSEY